MAVRTRFEKSNEVGCFAKLTDAYCLVASEASQQFIELLEAELRVKVVQT